MGSVLEMALLATIKDGTDPFIQFDGAELTEEQRPMFESLVVETHALTSSRSLDSTQFAIGLKPFGF